MDGRDAFLTLAREKHYEFSSLRRTKFSTMAMLYELHNQGQDRFVYTCNNCKKHVETRYHCTICDVSIFTYFLLVYYIFLKPMFLIEHIFDQVLKHRKMLANYISICKPYFVITLLNNLKGREKFSIKVSGPLHLIGITM